MEPSDMQKGALKVLENLKSEGHHWDDARVCLMGALALNHYRLLDKSALGSTVDIYIEPPKGAQGDFTLRDRMPFEIGHTTGFVCFWKGYKYDFPYEMENTQKLSSMNFNDLSHIPWMSLVDLLAWRLNLISKENTADIIKVREKVMSEGPHLNSQQKKCILDFVEGPLARSNWGHLLDQ